MTGGEPEDLQATYLARVQEGQPLLPGTALPMIGVHFRRRPSGLWVADSGGDRGPIDAVTSYITAIDVLGRPISADEFTASIRSGSPQAFVDGAAVFLAQLETNSVFDQRLQSEMARKVLSGPALNWTEAAINAGRLLFVPQVLLATMKTALILANTAATGSIPVGHLLGVMFFLGEILAVPEDEEAEAKWGGFPEHLSMEVARNQHFNRTVQLMPMMARYYRIWHELHPKLAQQAGGWNPAAESNRRRGCGRSS